MNKSMQIALKYIDIGKKIYYNKLMIYVLPKRTERRDASAGLHALLFLLLGKMYPFKEEHEYEEKRKEKRKFLVVYLFDPLSVQRDRSQHGSDKFWKSDNQRSTIRNRERTSNECIVVKTRRSNS